MKERLADSVSESKISTSFSNGPLSSMKRNRSISSSGDSQEDAISSLLRLLLQGELVAMELQVDEGFGEWVV